MAGHSQFANIKHRKDAQDSKKAKIFTKLLREITVSAKSGQPDPEFNARLRNAIIDARACNMPKDRIEAAVKRASSANAGDNFEEIRYEGYGPFGIAVIAQSLTDNRNRTASEVRSIFTKMGGSLGETNCVSFLFDYVGVIQFESKIASQDEAFEVAIEAGAQDVEYDCDFHTIITKPEEFTSVCDKLVSKFGSAAFSKLVWKSKDMIQLDQEKSQTISKMIDLLEDCDDVQSVTTNASLA